MAWTDQDDANWSEFETDSIRYLNRKGATAAGRSMFEDVLHGGRARVYAHGFDSDAMDRSKGNTHRFIDYALEQAEGDHIAPEHLDASLRSLCPVFPVC